MTPWDVAARCRFVTADGIAPHVVDEGPADAATTVVLVYAWTLATPRGKRGAEVAARIGGLT